MPSDHAAQPADSNVGWLIRKYLTYLPLVGFLVTLAITLVLGVDDWKVTALEVGLVWLVGVSGILLGSPHLFTPGPVADAIGWPTSRFQWEVGLAGVGYGVAGVIAPAFNSDFWLATIIVFSIFMLGAAVGHVRSMIAEHNFAPGNAGYIFWYDIAGLSHCDVRRHALTARVPPPRAG
jgi:hypothetical protein